MGGVLAWGRGGVLFLLIPLLLKYYREVINVECLFLKNKIKTFQLDLYKNLKEELLDLKSRCCFTLFGPVMQAS